MQGCGSCPEQSVHRLQPYGAGARSLNGCIIDKQEAKLFAERSRSPHKQKVGVKSRSWSQIKREALVCRRTEKLDRWRESGPPSCGNVQRRGRNAVKTVWINIYFQFMTKHLSRLKQKLFSALCPKSKHGLSFLLVSCKWR